MRDVKTIVITIEKELKEDTIANQLKGNISTIRVIHMDGKELYRDELKPDAVDSDDIIRQLEQFLEGRKFSGFTALPSGVRKWGLFSGMETAPYKDIAPIAVNIESLTGPVHVLTCPGTLRDSSVYNPDMKELHCQLFRSLRVAIEDGISTFEKSNGISHPQKEAPE